MIKIRQPSSYLESGIELVKKGSGAASGTGPRVFVFNRPSLQKWATALKSELADWQLKNYLDRDLVSTVGKSGPVVFLKRTPPVGPYSHGGTLEDSELGWFREQGGILLNIVKAHGAVSCELISDGMTPETWKGLFLGFELAAYQFKSETFASGVTSGTLPSFRLEVSESIGSALDQAQALGTATNFARHLVNLPPNVMHPESLSQFIAKTWKGFPSLSIDIWDHKRLEKEGMGLHLGVGAGSESKPALVCLHYRPATGKGLRPVALVGKGITFDTGGLDIKPSSGMRLMKKDMGGGAAVLGLALWAVETKYPAPLDFYVALAENSVDGRSFRPSDVLIARNGKSVEIHNTDAEGRLVLADALDVAVSREGKDEPELVIDLATLTGAIKTGLGTEIAGLFSNDDKLSLALERSGQKAGELNWRMPLFNRYAANFSSPFADILNAVDGWGGAITAALFLERFVRNKPWAHLDIYAWTDKATGSLGFAGANGQGVQTLAAFLDARVNRDIVPVRKKNGASKTRAKGAVKKVAVKKAAKKK